MLSYIVGVGCTKQHIVDLQLIIVWPRTKQNRAQGLKVVNKICIPIVAA
jgi:hypothetical protein